jgi:hypothetical protein
MAYQTLDICNAALVRIGEKPINSLDDDSPAARIVKLRYRAVFDFVLTLHPFSSALHRIKLLPDALYEKVLHYSYRYAVPNDCLRFLEVYDKNGEHLHDFELEGNSILTNATDFIALRYVRRVTDENLIDFGLGQLIALNLAWDIAQRLNPDSDRHSRQRGIYEEFQQQLRQLRRDESLKRPPNYYGIGDPFGDTLPDRSPSWESHRR